MTGISAKILPGDLSLGCGLNECGERARRRKLQLFNEFRAESVKDPAT
jgi:hypothetical protein